MPRNPASQRYFPKLSAKCILRRKSKVLSSLMYYPYPCIIIAHVYGAFSCSGHCAKHLTLIISTGFLAILPSRPHVEKMKIGFKLFFIFTKVRNG